MDPIKLAIAAVVVAAAAGIAPIPAIAGLAVGLALSCVSRWLQG